MKPKNKIVSVFDDIGIKVAKDMIEEQCCFLMAPSPLCSLEQACAPFANDPAPNPAIDEQGRRVRMVVALSPHNLKVYNQRRAILEAGGSYTITTGPQ
jgi:hypothetical protein